MGYTCYQLTKHAREKLLSRFRPQYPDVIADHITYRVGVAAGSRLPPATKDIWAIGYVNDGSLEALVVLVNGTMIRPDGKYFHITWSLDRSSGRKPVHSNEAIALHGYETITPVRVDARPAYQN
jgi:hypothetical protein